MGDNIMQSMTFAALMTALSELEESKENGSVKSPEEGMETPTFTARDDIDPSNGRERLYNMFLNIIHDADKACNVQTDTDDFDELINGMIVGTLYQAISEIDTDEGQKINIINFGLKYFGLNSELSGEMFFGDGDIGLGNVMINLSEVGLSLALEGSFKAGNPEAGAQFATSLTELIAYVEGAIKKAFPAVAFVTRPGEIPLKFTMDYYDNKKREMEEEDPSLLQPTQEEIEQKMGREDAEHLLSVARKERQDNHMESAAHLYQLVLERMPESWEAQFFSEFCPLYTESPDEVDIASISDNTVKFVQCADKSLPLVKKQLMTRADILNALLDIVNQCEHLAANYFTATMDFCRANNTRKERKNKIQRVGDVILMLFHVGDSIEKYFGDDKQTCSATAAACWHLAYTCYENCDMPVPAGARQHLDKMRIYDSSFRCSKPLKN